MKIVAIFLIVGLGIFVSALKGYTQEQDPKETVTEQDLRTETARLLDGAEKKFVPSGISVAKNRICSDNYFSGISQAVKYAAALSIYTDYETKLEREETRRLHQCKQHSEGCTEKAKKRIKRELEVLKGSVLADVDTFKYSLNNALERCRDSAERFGIRGGGGLYKYDPLHEDVSGFLDTSKEYKGYLKNREKLLKSFPKITLALSAELNKWNAPPPPRPRPEDPIVPEDTIKDLGG